MRDLSEWNNSFPHWYDTVVSDFHKDDEKRLLKQTLHTPGVDNYASHSLRVLSSSVARFLGVWLGVAILDGTCFSISVCFWRLFFFEDLFFIV